ncbi:hypothetical protein FDC50_16280 [Clostridium botulinum]|nr:hypothetical protein KU41_12665 [Clostridium botulinum]MBY6802533.1 hypothetical protein [Clostridium botulinum]MBY6819222.1 hypothetical protein [Clostridium botulinum]NFJ50637.1 hypothetical protein [Clostridium botulinum]NFP09144.1 hypothetical protein [Clostridium botulinum]
MILKSKRNIEKEGISVNQLYPVIECKENIQTGIKKFRIYDDCRSLSWKTINNFSIESVLLENYSKDIDVDTIHYTYNDLDKEFFYQFYLENEDSRIALVQLEKVIIDIISDELSIKDIMININELGLNNENIEMQLKAFFKEASKQDIIKFSNNMYNKVMDVNKYLLEVIVDNIKLYKEPEVENLLMEIYMSGSCSKEILNTIDNYWS